LSGEGVVALIEVGADERLLRVEMPVQRRLREPRGGDDVFDSDRSNSVAIEEAVGRLEKGRARARVDRAGDGEKDNSPVI